MLRNSLTVKVNNAIFLSILKGFSLNFSHHILTAATVHEKRLKD